MIYSDIIWPKPYNLLHRRCKCNCSRAYVWIAKWVHHVFIACKSSRMCNVQRTMENERFTFLRNHIIHILRRTYSVCVLPDAGQWYRCNFSFLHKWRAQCTLLPEITSAWGSTLGKRSHLCHAFCQISFPLRIKFHMSTREKERIHIISVI